MKTHEEGQPGALALGALLGDSELTKIQTVTRWVTSDGKDHCSLESAQWHARQMDATNKANAVLDAGGSVADALRAGEWPGNIEPVLEPVLERVTKATKLVISHWQCQDAPGYQVQYFRSDWKLWVWGNAGSWNGCYGNYVPLDDLARYGRHEATLFA